MADAMGSDGRVFWFLGIVEDIDDPLQIGRVRIRNIEDHNPSQSEYVETTDLPWAIPFTSINSSSRFGIGISPTGINVGSYVFGFYLDGEKKTKPAYLGTWPVYAEETAKHSVSRIARGINPVEKEYLPEEPKSQYASEYPFNKTMTTNRGHVIEVDDTPENERIHIFHRSGTYIEMNQDGSLVIKTASKRFDIVDNDHLESIHGRQDVTVVGDQKVVISKNQTIGVGGTISIGAAESVRIAAPGGVVITEGSLHVKGSLGTSIGATGTFTSVTGQIIHVQDGIITQID
jgi:hypothetical protein